MKFTSIFLLILSTRASLLPSPQSNTTADEVLPQPTQVNSPKERKHWRIPTEYAAHNSTCILPKDTNIVPITPNKPNAGWAMSPDQKCTSGSWCAYACRPGMVSVQWDPSVQCAAGPGCTSFNGGIKCGANREIIKPFPNKPFCEQGLENINIRSELDQSVSFCQTVYPGNEDMLIATVANPHCKDQIITSPPASYWMGTSAQFYVNPAGSTAANCNWGDPKLGPFGNWAPFVFGAGQAKDGMSFASLTMNPNFPSVSIKAPLYKISLICNNCQDVNPTPCFLDPYNNDTTACTITLPPGSQAVVLLS
ncbi:hypothetical protein DSO57_1019460 [Entomophthora muscae]|uniref:Uncharacterized protein n=1 Tax=Entomophthora muscae TaxID=34485 RepID=A0ACC2TRG8_9FUNG|nr:hypothetical protein DSO57_1019460 [Entomophthora muscae]